MRGLMLALWVVAGSGPAGADWPRWLERWMFNPYERTEQALEAFDEGRGAAAAAALDTALELAPGQPEVHYNAGTARLEAGIGDARGPLERAAARGPAALAPRAHYNLGNARLAAGDLPGAIEAFKGALRIDPDHADAKFNLELARRRLEEQQQEQEQQEQQEQEQQEQQEQEQDDAQRQDEQPSEEEQPESGESEPQDGQPPAEPPQGGQREESPLPQFRDLPDMTAEEAAAILEAIENMERERRREEAEKAQVETRGKKDW